MKPSIFIRGVFHSAYINETALNTGFAKLLNRGMVERSDIKVRLYNPATGDFK